MFEHQPTISMIKGKIREHTNFWDWEITILGILDIDKI